MLAQQVAITSPAGPVATSHHQAVMPDCYFLSVLPKLLTSSGQNLGGQEAGRAQHGPAAVDHLRSGRGERCGVSGGGGGGPEQATEKTAALDGRCCARPAAGRGPASAALLFGPAAAGWCRAAPCRCQEAASACRSWAQQQQQQHTSRATERAQHAAEAMDETKQIKLKKLGRPSTHLGVGQPLGGDEAASALGVAQAQGVEAEVCSQGQGRRGGAAGLSAGAAGAAAVLGALQRGAGLGWRCGRSAGACSATRGTLRRCKSTLLRCSRPPQPSARLAASRPSRPCSEDAPPGRVPSR